MRVPPHCWLVVVLYAAISGCVPGSRNELVSFTSEDTTLQGSLTLPAGQPPYPAVVFISGDSPQDRDGNPGTRGLYRELADDLVGKGIAVLRHDDRGAEWGGGPARTALEEIPGYRTLIADSRAAVAFVRGRREIDPGRVALVGHSEGAKTAVVLAAEDAQIAGIALLAGATAVNIDSLLIEQAQRSPNGPAPRLLALVDEVRSQALPVGPHGVTLWIREHLEIPPRALLARVRCPVLILQGEADTLVPPHHAEEAADVLRAAGNDQVTVEVFLGDGHDFRRTGELNPDPAVGRALSSWVAKTLGARGGRS